MFDQPRPLNTSKYLKYVFFYKKLKNNDVTNTFALNFIF